MPPWSQIFQTRSWSRSRSPHSQGSRRASPAGHQRPRSAAQPSPQPPDDDEASRLNRQAHLWRSSLGYVIHPKIPDLPAGARIADIGTGTGIWAVQLMQSLINADVHVTGFDITLEHLMPKGWVPLNVDFVKWDAVDAVPWGHRGVYDLVHIRLFMVNVVNRAELHRLLFNCAEMLKPGGYLQWEEVDTTSACVRRSDENAVSPALDELVSWVLEHAEKQRQNLDWLSQIGTLLETVGFVEGEVHRKTDPSHLRREFTETWLENLEELSSTRLQGTPQGTKNISLIAQAFGELYCGRQEVGVSVKKIITLAKKHD